jgi:hypothetical protein
MRSYRPASMNSRRQQTIPPGTKGRFLKAIGRVLSALGAAGATTAQIAIQMGDDIVRELGDEIIRDLPH